MRRATLVAVLVVTSGCYRSHTVDPETVDAGDPPQSMARDGGPDGPTGHHDAGPVPDGAVLPDAAVDASIDASDVIDAGPPPPPCGVPGPHRLSVGKSHSCFIDDECELYCWGSNERGQLGQGDTEPRHDPVRFDDGEWKAVEVFPNNDGEYRTCAIRADGSLWCAGRRLDRVVADQLAPVLWHGGPWTELSLSDSFNGIRSDGTLWAFGQNFRGAVGRGGMGWACLLDPYVDAFVEIGAGSGWSGLSGRNLGGCALRSGELWCWGANTGGELGFGDTETRCEPARVGTSDDWTLVTEASVTCTIREGGALLCAGYNALGAVDPANPASTVPTAVPIMEGDTFRSVGTGLNVTCAVRTDHALLCWGSNVRGLLGTSVPIAVRLGPVQLGAGIEWDYVDLDPHGTAACAVTSSGALHCWGENANGQVGTGDTDPVHSPAPIALP